MSESPRNSLPERHPVPTESVSTALDAVYNWSYEPEIDQIRTLYANALDRQWNGMRDLPWDDGIDREAFTKGFSVGGFPVTKTKFWSTLAPETRWEIARRSAAFMLSNFLHGEQAALMVAGQLVSAVPHIDGKFYAATQTLDEARHVEVFAAYLRELDEVYDISPSLRTLLDNVLVASDWKLKAVGMQVVTEGLALYSFRDMRNQTEEPLLEKLLTYVSRDEARHTAYGIKYLRQVVPTLDAAEVAEIEDFAFEASRLLIDQRAGYTMRDSVLALWKDAGVDPADFITAIASERELIAREVGASGGRFGPISGFVCPTLRSIGLLSDRIAGHFEDMWAANINPEAAREMRDSITDVPEDLEAWVNEGYEAL